MFSRRHPAEAAYWDYKSICAGNCPLKLITSINFVPTCPLAVRCSDTCGLVTLSLCSGFSPGGVTHTGEASPASIRRRQRKRRFDSRWILMFARHGMSLHCSPKCYNQYFRKHPCWQPQSRLTFPFLNVNAVLVTVTGIRFSSPWDVLKAFAYHHEVLDCTSTDSVVYGFHQPLRCERLCNVTHFGPKGICSDLFNLYKYFYFILAGLLWICIRFGSQFYCCGSYCFHNVPAYPRWVWIWGSKVQIILGVERVRMSFVGW